VKLLLSNDVLEEEEGVGDDGKSPGSLSSSGSPFSSGSLSSSGKKNKKHLNYKL
jgi:hypothetical protein